MGRKKDETQEDKTKCYGGKSLWCNHFEHDQAAVWWNCRKCGRYMGCRLCAQMPKGIICSVCKDWALQEGEIAHGAMVPRNKTTVGEVREMLKKVDPVPTVGDGWDEVPF